MDSRANRQPGYPRIVFIGTGKSAALLGLIASGRNVVGIVQNVARKKNAPSVSKRSALYRFASSGYRRLRRDDSMARFAADRQVPFYLMNRGCDETLERWVRHLAPDLIVVCGMVELLKSKVYSIPPLGAINLHPSVLPRHRGPDPFFWTYYHMDAEGGATVHFIDDGADTGDILAQESVPIPLGLPRRELIRITMGEIGPRLLSRSIDQLADGSARPVPQPAESPTPPARRVAPGKHAALVEWEAWTIERVWHFLRGTEPLLYALDPPPAWRREMGWRVGPHVKGACSAPAGSIQRDSEGFFAAHPEGRIRLFVRYSVAGLVRAILSGPRMPRPVPPAARAGGP